MRGLTDIWLGRKELIVTTSLKTKMQALDPERRQAIENEADRLQVEYLSLQELRKAQALTQAQLATHLGLQQATIAKYERQTDLLLSTLTSYVRAMGGSLKLIVEFPGKDAVALDGYAFGDREHKAAARRKRSSVHEPAGSEQPSDR